MNTEYEVRSIAEETMSSKHSTSMIECSNSSGGFCGVFSVGLFFWGERKKERLEIVLESGYAMSCDVSACKENLFCSSFSVCVFRRAQTTPWTEQQEGLFPSNSVLLPLVSQGGGGRQSASNFWRC
uniref:Uncharacterized protein n=1 Tax=Eutreptiella gymnastica TaxID=73025 RepID=A0A7S4GBV9_9EUGL